MARTTTNRGTGVLQVRPTDRHIRIDDDGNPVEVVGVRQRFGGIDVGASIAGALAALGVTVLLGAIAGSIGTIGYQLDVERGTDTLSAGGLAVGLVILAAAFLVGGWVAGRIGRYDGGRNGLLAAVWFIVVAAILGGAGAWLGDKYDVFRDLPVPQWFHDSNTTAVAIVSGIVAAIVMLAAGFLGGVVGTRYHERADAYLMSEERDLLTHDAPIEVLDDDSSRRAGDVIADREAQPVHGEVADQRPVAEPRDIADRDIDLRRVDEAPDRPAATAERPFRESDVHRAGPTSRPGPSATR